MCGVWLGTDESNNTPVEREREREREQDRIVCSLSSGTATCRVPCQLPGRIQFTNRPLSVAFVLVKHAGLVTPLNPYQGGRG